MSFEELVTERQKLDAELTDLTMRAREARDAAEKCSHAIEIFDAEHPEVMRGFNDALGRRKKEMRGSAGTTVEAHGEAEA